MTQFGPDTAAGTLRPGDVAVIQGQPIRTIRADADGFWGSDPIAERPEPVWIGYDLLEDGPAEYLPREHSQSIATRLEEIAVEREEPPDPDEVEDSPADDGEVRRHRRLAGRLLEG